MTQTWPEPGMTIPLTTGTVTITAVKHGPHDRIVVLATRDHTHHQYGTWRYDPARRALLAGHFFLTMREAHADFNERT